MTLPEGTIVSSGSVVFVFAAFPFEGIDRFTASWRLELRELVAVR